ncbi:hypothetical protein HER10_EVM0000242 [Colletotrichum scovillei]|uniref:Amidohydrolase 3 protein n=1 Tax=Colletotrichum scovillei TaxID=1209932 RepID=A0A9P7RGU4_9PEZI|nr:uncharacterized protein HER10_EVM0000242 [Colletotrichum scovillei]KAF4779012.1 hypothetical protein HER10_EVM0000242 [Colletotrichum scovillei]KAG7057254.1 amidohydrolase 3 protein [Colletotrichum scovillei]KAG7075820.1 amidohydrolase 3 protein [Colletotrichum scovillei]KAG7082935.1 amidohydrolase 3 protein [Colletotrichum scovillei]
MSSGDSRSLRASYEAYKLSTNCFLGWMVAQYKSARPGDDNPRPITFTSDIVKVAKVLHESNTVVPLSVIGALHHAIEKRQEVGNIYKHSGAEDPSHDHFVKRLQETSRILKPLMEASKRLPNSEIPGIDAVTLNQFAALALEGEEHNDDGDVSPILPSTSKVTAAPHRRSAKGKVVVRQQHCKVEVFLEDDDMCRVFEVSFLLYQAALMRDQLMQFWTEAAKRTLPIPVAAWLTSTVFLLGNQLVGEYFPSISEEMHEYCVKVLKFLVAQPEIDSEIDGLFNFRRFCDFYDFIQSWKRNRDHFAQRGDLLKAEHDKVLIRRDPDTPHVQTTPDGKYDEEHMLGALEVLQNSCEYWNEKRPVERLEVHEKAFLVRAGSSEPLLFYLTDFHDCVDVPPPEEEQSDSMDPPDHTASTDVPYLAPLAGLILGLDLLITTFDIFRWPNGESNEDLDARDTALDLATQMRNAVDSSSKVVRASLDSVSYTALLEKMDEFHGALDAYATEDCTQFYYRAPWTAGGHMGEMLFQAQHMGRYMVGCCTGGGLCIVPATLHLYNALRRSDFNLAEIPIMEEVCNLFKVNVFQGDLPDRNFLSIYRRIVYGGPLNKTKSAIEWKSNKSIVPPLSSIFCDQHAVNHKTGPVFLARINGQSAPTTKAEEEKIVKKSASQPQPLTTVIHMAKETVLAEFNGPVPVARINYFAIFDLCVKVLENFGKIIDESDLKDAVKFIPPVELHAIRGMSMVDSVLDIIVDNSKTYRKRKKLSELKWLVHASKAFEVVDRDATLSQFLWNV